MKKNKWIFEITVFAMCIVFSSCIKEPVTGVMLNEDYLIIPPGSTVTLIATVEPSDASNHNVSWHSDNTEIATVNRKGVVNAITEGNATITTTTKDGNFQATCKIIVDKNALPPSDYRFKWIGSYDCEEINNWWSMDPLDPDGSISVTTIFQTIVDVAATKDSSLIITENRSNRTYEMKVDVLGNFYYPLNHGRLEGIFIANDSLKMSLIDGMQAYSSTSIYKGKKLKSK